MRAWVTTRGDSYKGLVHLGFSIGVHGLSYILHCFYDAGVFELIRFLKVTFWAALLGAILGAAQLLWWVMSPLSIASPTLDLSIEPGTPVKQIAQEIVKSGVDIPAYGLYLIFRLSGQAKQIRAGSYEITRNDTGWDLLEKLIRGQENLRALTLVEGWNMNQFRALLERSDGLRHETTEMSDREIMQMLGHPELAAEGRFYPDTYTYGKGSTDKNILKRAFHSMEKHLTSAWSEHPSTSILKSADEALILASIVEKETGHPSDRPMISSVFNNRLLQGMPLQTDPTVIYGLGANFDGNLRKADLRANHPWNTYIHTGLPPTPIAMPGKAALLAAVHPASSDALYFVAKGDGRSQFSKTLEEHNAAVQKYQLNRTKDYTSAPTNK